MKKTLLILALMLVLLVSVCIAGCQQNDTTTPTTEPTEAAPPVMEAYYNVDGAKYNNSGVSSRPAEADGTYKVMFSRKGKPVTLTVKADQELINKIDSLTVLGLEVDESKVVTGVKTVEDMGGKIVYDGYYIYVTGRATIVIHEDKNFTDEGVELSVPSNQTTFTDLVTDPSKPDKTTYGDLLKGDQIFAVQDYEGKITDIFFYKGGMIRNGIDQYCPHCCEEGQTVHFDAWTQATSAVEDSGHCFLIEDLELGDQLSIGPNVKLVLDLNGYTISVVGNKRVISIHNEGAYLGLMDTSEEKTGKVVAQSPTYSGYGATVWVRKGTFDLFSGTLDASMATSGVHGPGVYIPSGSTFNMYGGTIIGGTTINNTKEDGGFTGGGHGGSVYVGGTFNMYGGEIYGGKAMANGSNTGRGGNIAVMGGATFNMSGGYIHDGTADNPEHGAAEGDIYLAKSGKLNQTGGTIGTTTTSPN